MTLALALMLAIAMMLGAQLTASEAASKPRKLTVSEAHKVALSSAEKAYDNDEDAEDYGADKSSCHRISRRKVECVSYILRSVEVVFDLVDYECDWWTVVTRRKSGRLSVGRRDIGCFVY